MAQQSHTLPVKYSPHSRQKLFHKDNHRYRLFLAGYGTGKTSCAVIETYLQATVVHPGKRGCLVAPTETMLRDTLIAAWIKLIPSSLYELKVKDKKIILYNGSEILLRSTAVPSGLEGLNLAYFVMDECFREKREEAFRILEGRLRDPFPGKEARGMYIGTPQGPAHYLCSQFGLAPDGVSIHGNTDHFWKGNRATIRAKTSDNPYVDKAALADWLKNDPNWVKQYINAEYVSREGLVYDQFQPTKHVITHSQLPRMLRYYLAGDYGQSAPGTLMVVGEGADNRFYVVDEVYKTRTVYRWDDGWGPIFEAKRNQYKPQYCVFDSSAPEAINELRKATKNLLPFYTPIKNNADAINRLQNLFSRDKLFISDRCTNLQRELLSFSYKQNKDGVATEETDKHASDHCIDATKYLFLRLAPPGQL